MFIRKVGGELRKFIGMLRTQGVQKTVQSTLQYVVALAGGLTRDHADEWNAKLTVLRQTDAEYRERVARLEQQLSTLQRSAELFSSSISALALSHIAATVAEAAALPLKGPLVTVILPVWNRRQSVGRTIESVLAQSYPHWELIVVDDGSTDQTSDVVERYLEDRRIRLFKQANKGASAARNYALAHAKGEIIAYIDSDNTWCAYYLAKTVSALQSHPNRDCVYFSQLVENPGRGLHYIRSHPFDRDRLHREHYIDLNVFAHRRSVFEQYGGFDEQLTRLVDWDLIARYTRDRDPVHITAIGGTYVEHNAHSISIREGYWLNYYRVRRKLLQPVKPPLRVLYALWHYPQLTETYVRWEIACMRRWGVDIEVFAEVSACAAPYDSEVPVHYGSLAEAMERFQPHLVHVHWLNFVPRYRDAVARAGLQLTARGHSFEFSPELVRELEADPIVSAYYIYPHFARSLPGHRKARSVKSAFNGDLYYPENKKDPRLVVRAGTGLPTKDLETFIQTAKMCPDHRFVLALGRATGEEAYTDELIAYNHRHGSPVDIRVNLQADAVAALIREAGIFLHTFGFQAPFGMPMCIGEAMATGAYVLVRRCPGAESYVGDVGAYYDSAEEAGRLIRECLDWSEEHWRAVRRATVERAYEQHADLWTLRPILEDWLRITRCRTARDPNNRPLDNRFQHLIDYLFQHGMDRFPHHDAALTAHQMNIGRELLSWGCDVDVCLAGIVHSIYGTEKGGTGYDVSRRDELRKLIGERAERLAYYNCAMTRSSFDAALARTSAPFHLSNRLTGGSLELSEQDFMDLCRIHLCDWLEQVPRCGRWNERRESYRRMAKRLGGRALAAFERVYNDPRREKSQAHATPAPMSRQHLS